MNKSQQVLAILRLEALAKQANKEAAQRRQALAAAAEGEYESEGVAPTWRLPDLGRVSTSISSESVSVSDGIAFKKWVADRYPEEIVTDTTVRSSWAMAFMDRVVADGEFAVDPSTGEIVQGLTVRKGGVFKGISIAAEEATKRALAAVAEHDLAEFVASLEKPVTLAEAGDVAA